MLKLPRPRATPLIASAESGITTILTPHEGLNTRGTLDAGGSRLSEGAIIHVVARVQVFGLNLVRLEARIDAAPARLRKVERLLPSFHPSAARPTTRSDRDPERSGEQGWHLPPKREPVIGSRLGEALDLLSEGAASLAAASE